MNHHHRQMFPPLMRKCLLQNRRPLFVGTQPMSRITVFVTFRYITFIIFIVIRSTQQTDVNRFPTNYIDNTSRNLNSVGETAPAQSPLDETDQPTVTSFPTYEQKCNVCNNNPMWIVQDPDKEISFFDLQTSCGELEWAGWNGYLPPELCDLAIDLITENCNCMIPSQNGNDRDTENNNNNINNEKPASKPTKKPTFRPTKKPTSKPTITFPPHSGHAFAEMSTRPPTNAQTKKPYHENNSNNDNNQPNNNNNQPQPTPIPTTLTPTVSKNIRINDEKTKPNENPITAEPTPVPTYETCYVCKGDSTLQVIGDDIIQLMGTIVSCKFLYDTAQQGLLPTEYCSIATDIVSGTNGYKVGCTCVPKASSISNDNSNVFDRGDKNVIVPTTSPPPPTATTPFPSGIPFTSSSTTSQTYTQSTSTLMPTSNVISIDTTEDPTTKNTATASNSDLLSSTLSSFPSYSDMPSDTDSDQPTLVTTVTISSLLPTTSPPSTMSTTTTTASRTPPPSTLSPTKLILKSSPPTTTAPSFSSTPPPVKPPTKPAASISDNTSGAYRIFYWNSNWMIVLCLSASSLLLQVEIL